MKKKQAPRRPDEKFPAAEYWKQRLHTFVETCVVRYGSPVYLVGGALKERAPRDVDVRVCILKHRWHRRFDVSSYGDWLRDHGTAYLREVVKMNQVLQDAVPPGVGADLHVWPHNVFQPLVGSVLLGAPVGWTPGEDYNT